VTSIVIGASPQVRSIASSPAAASAVCPQAVAYDANDSPTSLTSTSWNPACTDASSRVMATSSVSWSVPPSTTPMTVTVDSPIG
jgi:hypothetical protein